MDEFRYDHIVVRYGELTTKGKNRKDFIRRLADNIKARLSSYEKLTYKVGHDGIFIALNGEEYETVKEDLKDVFGFANFSGALLCKRDLEQIKDLALSLARKKDYKSFKITARRSDKTYPHHSDEIIRKVATHILMNTELKVDVHEPDLTIFITIDPEHAIIMDEKVKGRGGYPTGINGNALVMMSGGIDSPVAAYMTMKRGLHIECIHFASMPYTSKQALDKVLTLAKQISVCQGSIRVHVIPFTDLQLAIYDHCDEPYAITIMRRMMYRIADQIAKENKMLCITNGESIGQVASQTPESISVISKVCDTLILRPLCMMDKLEIIDIARKIGTYETSILPYEDCCTIFDPKNPVTHPKLDRCLKYEQRFDYETLVSECVKNREIIEVSYKDKEKEEDLF